MARKYLNLKIKLISLQKFESKNINKYENFVILTRTINNINGGKIFKFKN